MSLNMMMAVETTTHTLPYTSVATAQPTTVDARTVIGIGTSATTRQRGNDATCAQMFANYTLPYASPMLSFSNAAAAAAAVVVVIPVGTLTRSLRTSDIIYLLLLSACKRHCRTARCKRCVCVC